MEFTKEQLSEVICKHTERENVLQDLMEIMLESMMVSERREFLREESQVGNKGNGYRPGRTYGHGRTLSFRIPRDRYGNFHPQILAILRDQEEECERLAGTLYTKGLTQEQVGEVFADIYGEHYSKASISRMLDYLRKDVSEWQERSLESYYPIVFIDCVHIKIHRKRSVDTEAFYVILAVKEDKTRDVLGIYIKRRGEDPSYKAYFTYLSYDSRIQSMIYTTNWIERLQKDFRRVTRMRGAMPSEESVILLMAKTAMDKKSYARQVPRIDMDKNLFPDD